MTAYISNLYFMLKLAMMSFKVQNYDESIFTLQCLVYFFILALYIKLSTLCRSNLLLLNQFYFASCVLHKKKPLIMMIFLNKSWIYVFIYEPGCNCRIADNYVGLFYYL